MRLIFLVHGMGEHKVDGEQPWWQPLIDQLLQTAKKYPKAGALKDARFVALTYDDILQKFVADWQDNAAHIAKLGPLVGADKIAELAGWIKAPDASLGKFFWSHVVDVLLYRYFSLVRQGVWARLANQFTAAVQQARKEDNVEVFVVAHSLGTAVMHDLLHQLFIWPAPTDLPTYNPQIFKVKALVMVSNVSGVLELPPPGVYRSLVKPEGPGGSGGCVERFINIRHKLDPFWMPKRFEPAVDWIPAAYRDGPDPRFRLIEVDHLHEANVHGLEHYFLHPAAHVALFRALFGYNVVDDVKLAQAEQDFPRIRLNVSLEKQAALQRLLEYNRPQPSDDLMIWRKLVKDYVSAIN